jgi:ribosome biogenesis protein ERB1
MDDKDKLYNFIPKKHDCLRHVAGYSDFVKERFERCLDLYLCPRKMKRRLNIDPETLVPRLPRPSELKPFPNALCLQFLGHKKGVQSISLSPDGQFLASGSADCTVRLWEVDTALCLRVWKFASPVLCVQFNPNIQHHILLVVVDTSVILVATGTGDEDSTDLTEALLSKGEEVCSKGTNDETANPKWSIFKGEGTSDTWYDTVVGPRLVLSFKDAVTSASWHHKGDYLVSLCMAAGAKAIGIHQLSKAKTQFPFTKTTGRVQAVNFHPTRPFIFVTTQQHVKVSINYMT